MSRTAIEQLEIRNSAILLKQRLEASKDSIAREFLNGSLGEAIDKAINGSFETLNEVPSFELISRGILQCAEDEYMNFYSWVMFGKPAFV